MAAQTPPPDTESMELPDAAHRVPPELIMPAPGASQDQQIVELRELTRSLMVAVQSMQAQASRNAVFQDAIADVKSATRAMMTAPAGTPAVRQNPNGTVSPDAAHGECGCSSCISDDCCCFEIVLEKIRGIQPQGLLEPADAGDTTLPLPTINELEVRLFVSIDNIGVLIPSLSTTMGVRVPSILAGGGPGLWMPIGAVVGRVNVRKGTTETFTFEIQGAEIDEGAERVLGFKDEHGAATGSITLDCCSAKIYPPMPTDLSFDQGGIGGGQPGAISLAFFARRVCC
ncbi:MAG: hypothetical protein WC729_24430 [Sphingomonas sp.]|uniref:hypothetical protein n=1 Tax=Sphingomonas sp. TaxID=28214 RepID=UPI00356A0143